MLDLLQRFFCASVAIGGCGGVLSRTAEFDF